MTRSPGRTGHRYRQLCAQVRASEPDCWVCGRPIDLTLRFPNRWSWSLDHVVPLMAGGDPLARSNAHSAHLTCNVGRGNRDRAALARARKATREAPIVHSRQW